MSDIFNTLYKPDVLSCLADLSNDEVFTPPSVVNDMLDMLPQELFESPNTTFLDPVCKSGVFLREIAKRLIKGLEPVMPDLQERIDHIFQKQLYGIAITELTSLLSRRSVYCSKYPNSKFSVSQFDSVQGNIRYKNTQHTFVKGKCCFCGATESEYGTAKRDGMESHAYEFIHTTKPEEIYNMKFDVIIGNPPYQLNVGVQQKSYAISIYDKFVEKSKRLNPRFLVMITPSRWFSGGRGLDEFRNIMLNDKRMKIIHDYIDASDCFSGVEIKGGVCYFLLDSEYNGDCEIYTHKNKNIQYSKRALLEAGNDTFIRYNQAISIIHKVRVLEEKSFSEIVSPQTPFGLYSSFDDFSEKQDEINSIKLYANKQIGYIHENIIHKNNQWIKDWKVYIPKAIGSGDMETDVFKPIIGEPNSACTQTYILIGPFSDKETTENVITYMKTKFFHFLVGLKKVTQDAMAKVYQFVPIQDFTKSWTDEELYAKYNLTQDEIDFIESMIRPME